MAIGVRYVEVTLTPAGVLGGKHGGNASVQGPSVLGIDIVHIEYSATPPADVCIRNMDQIQEAGARDEAARLAADAASRLDLFGKNAILLRQTAEFAVNRRH